MVLHDAMSWLTKEAPEMIWQWEDKYYGLKEESTGQEQYYLPHGSLLPEDTCPGCVAIS
jgi:hypothetical protein